MEQLEERPRGSLSALPERSLTWERARHVLVEGDNLDALRFYQRRGYRLVAVHTNAVTDSRADKPTIPLAGQHDIPLCDEIEMAKRLDE